MKLHEVYEAIQPSIVAFVSAAVPSHEGDSVPDAQPFPKYLEVPAQVPNGELCIVFSAKAVAQCNKYSQAMLVEAAKLAPRHGTDLALVYDKDKQKENAKHALSNLLCERSPANQALLTLVFGLRMKDHSARTYNNIVIASRERPYASG